MSDTVTPIGGGVAGAPPQPGAALGLSPEQMRRLLKEAGLEEDAPPQALFATFPEASARTGLPEKALHRAAKDGAFPVYALRPERVCVAEVVSWIRSLAKIVKRPQARVASKAKQIATTAPITDPENAIIRLPEVKAQVGGVSTSTIYRWEGEGSFPKRIALGGGSVGWRASEVKEWVQQRPVI